MSINTSVDPGASGVAGAPVPANLSADERRELLRRLLAEKARGRQCPVSFAQLRLWFVSQLVTDSWFYNSCISLHLTGPLDPEALQGALDKLTARHETLRTSFKLDDGGHEPVQVIEPSVSMPLEIVDLRTTPAAQRDEESDRIFAAFSRVAFDLSQAPLMRVKLVRKDDEVHELLIVVHHIAFDGWSFQILYRDLIELYESQVEGRAPSLDPIPVQYADYAEWQRRHLRDEVIEAHLDYWRRHLDGMSILDLPLDQPRPITPTYEGARESVELPLELAEALERLSRSEGATLYMTVFAAFTLLMHRYSGQDDIVIGGPVAGRSHPDVENIVGCFVNTIVFRTDVSGTPTFRELLQRVRDTCLGAFEHDDLPFERLVNALDPERDLARNPLYDVSFDLLSVDEPLPATVESGLTIEPISDRTLRAARLDIEGAAMRSPTAFGIQINYRTELFESKTIQRMLEHFERLLRSVADDADRAIDELDMFGDEERTRLIVERNDTAVACPDLTVPALATRTAAARPDATAVVCGDTRLTYDALERSANRLARHLTANGVGPGHRVGISIERSAELVVAVLGVLKTGAAYVPLDATLPEERLRFLREDADLTTTVSAATMAEAASASDDPFAPGCTLDDIAYVIYTSGSTGRPKGVEVGQRAVVNFLESMRREPGVTADDVVLALTNLSFDIATLELLLPLVVGATIVMVPADAAADARAIAALLETHGVTVMQATPATWQLLVQSGWRGRADLRMLCGGEAMPQPLADALLERGAELWNMYGPTETTVWSATTRVGKDDGVIHIGHPIANTQLYVMDERGHPVPDGAVGELWIGGEGVARGYFRRPELTAERFVPDPFRGGRLYRTGDLVRYDSAGRLRFLGRIDHQIKLRGFRIELGEIESALVDLPEVRTAAVLCREDDPGEKRLAAYIVPASGGDLAVNALRERLLERLPAYMVPAAFVRLDAMPLNASGKVDRRALPVPDAVAGGTNYVAPRTETERLLVEVWANVLRVERVGVHDNFFALGGHSLILTRMLSRTRAQTGIDLPLITGFQRPTIAELAEAIDVVRSMSTTDETAPAGEREEIEL